MIWRLCLVRQPLDQPGPVALEVLPPVRIGLGGDDRVDPAGEVGFEVLAQRDPVGTAHATTGGLWASPLAKRHSAARPGRAPVATGPVAIQVDPAWVTMAPR